MRKFLMPITVLVIFVAILLVLVIGISNAPREGRKDIVSPLLGKAAPEFTLPKLLETGERYDGKSLQGGWHLVNVWGTWCGECRAEHAMLLQIKAEGRVPIVGIDWKDEDASATAWLSQLGNPYETVVTDHSGRAAIDWGVYGAPESFLVDPHGIVVEKQIGAMTPEVWQTEFLPHLQARAAAGAKAGA